MLDELILYDKNGLRFMIRASDITDIIELEDGTCQVNTVVDEFEADIDFDSMIRLRRKALKRIGSFPNITEN